jgi:hypothetical protein
MLNKIVTVDESWVRHYQPESKRASMKWKHPSSLSTKKFKVPPTAGKVFWDYQGILLAHFQKRGENVNSVEASGCHSQKTSRPTGNGVGTAS